MDTGFRLEHQRFESDARSYEGVALVLVERGELRVYLAPGEPTRLGDGDVLALGPLQSARISAWQAEAHGIVFRAQPDWLVRALALAGLDPGSLPTRPALLRAGTHAARHAALRLRELAAPVSERVTETRLARTARALELLETSIAAGFGALADPPRQRRSPARFALANELEALAHEPTQGLTLSRLAMRLGLSERQASRLVHERLGISLGEHLAVLRVARAKRLLAESDLAVIDVAAEAGFGSLGHFNHVFRSHSGSTPSAFRRASRRDAEAMGEARAQLPETGGATASDGA